MVMSAGASAYDGKGRWDTHGYKKLNRCGAYVQARREGPNHMFEAWMRGYMTAVNSNVPGKKDFFEGVSDEALLLWVERWCLKNPLKGITVGLGAFLETRGVKWR